MYWLFTTPHVGVRIQVSQTKDLARFHTPEVLKLQQELLRARESRNIAARQAWAELISQVSFAVRIRGPL